ncbi:hypothetical protein Taro_043237, partial [Colocasia esculenta]|nr:hypothetical protein [Colocasia esculenta]
CCNDPTSRTSARDPEGPAATHGSEDPEGYKKKSAILKGHTPRTCKKATLNSHSTRVLTLITHTARNARWNQPPPQPSGNELLQQRVPT